MIWWLLIHKSDFSRTEFEESRGVNYKVKWCTYSIVLCESTRGAGRVGLNHLCDAMRAWKKCMSLFDKWFYQLTEENDVAEVQSALFVLTLQDRVESEHKLSLQKRYIFKYIVNLKLNWVHKRKKSCRNVYQSYNSRPYVFLSIIEILWQKTKLYTVGSFLLRKRESFGQASDS